MNTLEHIIENYINGNISYAKKKAKRFSEYALSTALVDIGYSERKARLTAAHMKGEDCWQEACNAS